MKFIYLFLSEIPLLNILLSLEFKIIINSATLF